MPSFTSYNTMTKKLLFCGVALIYFIIVCQTTGTDYEQSVDTIIQYKVKVQFKVKAKDTVGVGFGNVSKISQ